MELDNFTSLYSRPIGSGSRNWVEFAGTPIRDWQNIDDSIFIPVSGDGLIVSPKFQANGNPSVQSWQFNPVNYDNLCQQIKIHFNASFKAYSVYSGGSAQVFGWGVNRYLPVILHWKLNGVWNSGEMDVLYYGENLSFSHPAPTGWNTFVINTQVPSGYFNDFEIGFSTKYSIAGTTSEPAMPEQIDTIYAEIVYGNPAPLYINGTYLSSTGNIPLFLKNLTYESSGVPPLYTAGHIKTQEGLNLSVFDYGGDNYWPPVNSTIPPKFIYNYQLLNTTPITVDVLGSRKWDNWTNIGTFGNGKSPVRWANGSTDVVSLTQSPPYSILVPPDYGFMQTWPLSTVQRFTGYAKNIRVKFDGAFYDVVTEEVSQSPYQECSRGDHTKAAILELVNYPRRSGVFSGNPYRSTDSSYQDPSPLAYDGWQISWYPEFKDMYGFNRSCGAQIPNLENYAAVNTWKTYTISLSELNSYNVSWDDFVNLQVGLKLFFRDGDASVSNLHGGSHAYIGALGVGRIKNLILEFEVPTMPMYIEGGTWETVSVPLYGLCEDGLSKNQISLFNEGHGFPASGLIPLYTHGLPFSDLSTPLYAHNFAPLDSGLSIYTSGMYGSELRTSLYTLSGYTIESGRTLYTYGLPGEKLAVPTYVAGPIPINDSISTYISGPLPINSGFGLVTYNQFGERAVVDSAPLYTQSAYFSNTGIPINTFGVYSYDFDWAQNGWPKPYSTLYIKGLYYEQSGKMPLFTKTSSNGVSNSFDLADGIGLFTKQVGIEQTNPRSLYIHNVGEVYNTNSVKTLYVHSPQPIYSIDDSVPLTVYNNYSGKESGVPLYVQYLRDISIFDPLYFELEDNAIPTDRRNTLFIYNNNSAGFTPLMVKVSEPINSGLSVYLEGTNRATSGIPLYGFGLGNWANSVQFYTHGF